MEPAAADIASGRDPAWREAWEERLDEPSRAMLLDALKNGAAVRDPNLAPYVAGLIARKRRALRSSTALSVVVTLGTLFWVYATAVRRPSPLAVFWVAMFLLCITLLPLRLWSARRALAKCELAQAASGNGGTGLPGGANAPSTGAGTARPKKQINWRRILWGPTERFHLTAMDKGRLVLLGAFAVLGAGFAILSLLQGDVTIHGSVASRTACVRPGKYLVGLTFEDGSGNAIGAIGVTCGSQAPGAMTYAMPLPKEDVYVIVMDGRPGQWTKSYATLKKSGFEWDLK